MARPAQWPPPIVPHGSGQARCRISGKDYYLGRIGSPDVQVNYAELLRKHAAGELIDTVKKRQESGKEAAKNAPLSVAEALTLYLAHAEQHYRSPDGEPTSQMGYVARAISFLLMNHGKTPAAEFRAKSLKAVREEMIAKGWARGNVNQHVGVIKRMFRWLASEELVPGECYQSLRSVEGLKAGRSAAKETLPVLPVALDVVEAVLPYLSPHLADAARLQLACACRPGEALALRPVEIEMTGEVWTWRPARHKTAYRGRGRTILLGPRAQAVILSLLTRQCPLCGTQGRARRIGWRDGLCGPCADFVDEEEFSGPWPVVEIDHDYLLFSPRESEAERAAVRRAMRRSKVQPSQLCRRVAWSRHPPGASYDTEAYAHALRRACDRAGVERFNPHRLRHTAGTLIAAEFGIVVAQTQMGHASLKASEVYIERDLKPAAEAMKRVG